MRSTGNTTALACGSGLGTGIFAGLMGLGGAELRMPLLISAIGLPPQRAVPINLCVSLVTLTVGAITRLAVVTTDSSRLGWEIVAVAAGSVCASYMATSLFRRLPEGLHIKLIAVLLLVVAYLMVSTAQITSSGSGLLPASQGVRFGVGFCIGLLVGTVSAMFGVAGGQMTIPSLVFAFGMDIKLAGTGSLLINLPTVLTAVLRMRSSGLLRANVDMTVVTIPMAAGSVVGAATGGVLAGVVSAQVLRFAFAAVLAWSAIAMLGRRASKHRA